MRYYKYNLDYLFIGYEDSETQPIGSTEIEPISSNHILWNPELKIWEEEAVIGLTFDEEKQVKIDDVHNFFDDLILTVKSGTAVFEEATYRTQEVEWRAWEKDNTVDTPYVNILSNRRNIDKTILMEKIGQKVMFFADIQGQMHALEDSINTCTNIEELNSLIMPWDV